MFKYTQNYHNCMFRQQYKILQKKTQLILLKSKNQLDQWTIIMIVFVFILNIQKV